MTPSTELFDLIKTLTKSEKRFFKLSASLQSGNKNYLLLFDAIGEQKEYNEQAIKEQFKEEKFIKHLPSEKNYLYNLILKSLRGYYAEKSIGSLLKQEIKNIEILYNKALFKSCRKQLKRSKKKAEEYEKFYYWFELISWEKKLIEEEYEQGVFNHDLENLIDEELEVIEKLRNLAEYQMLLSQINAIFRTGLFNKSSKELTKVNEIAGHPLIVGKNTALSQRATSICYYIQGVCSAVVRDYEKALPNFKKTLTILDNHPKIKMDLSGRYVNTLKHLIYSYIDIGNMIKAQELVDIMLGLADKRGFDSIDVQLKIFTFSSNTQVIILDHLGKFKEALTVVQKMIEGLEEYKEKINKEQRILFYYNIAYIYFGNGYYKEALRWINEIINDNEKRLRQDIYGYSEILNMLIHLELQNHEYVEQLAKTARKHIRKQIPNYDFELEVVNFIVKLARKGKIDNEGIKSFKSQHKDLSRKVLQDYFDLNAWLGSKMNNSTMEQEVILRKS